MVQIESVPFCLPGGEGNSLSPKRPIDLIHLARQTMDDRDVEQEVLSVFSQQCGELVERLGKAEAVERAKLAHKLKGSAKSIGAFRLAECAAGIEANPGNGALLRKLSVCAKEVREFINSITR